MHLPPGKVFCPTWSGFEGRCAVESIRKSIDLTNWEAAAALVRDGEIEGYMDIPSVSVARERFIADMETRSLPPDTSRSSVCRARNCRIEALTADDIAKILEKWELKPSTAAKKLERLKSFFRFGENRKWLADNPAKRAPTQRIFDRCKAR